MDHVPLVGAAAGHGLTPGVGTGGGRVPGAGVLRLRCVAARGVFLPPARRPRGTTDASAYAVTPGRAYGAVGVLALADHLSVLVRDDWGGPAFVPAELFAGVAAAVPAGWAFALDSGARAGRRTLWGEPVVAVWGYPALVEEDGHAAALLAGDARAVALFDEACGA
ncbi:hypothetical protein FA014_15050 [Cellulomonas hominis]|uniref:Uncharacterized protein n=1 Tax=Cellulomonas hominis TaxID=156981 RepID=A0A7Z8JX27_9CELL|nr:hypothetical protein [Cellulomonas hominis]TKR22704.1 hypothetical protein FA014_15050 [Cellulomonas hominis]